MHSSSGMQRRSRSTWKGWVGILVGLAVVAGLVVLIANVERWLGRHLLTNRSSRIDRDGRGDRDPHGRAAHSGAR